MPLAHWQAPDARLRGRGLMPALSPPGRAIPPHGHEVPCSGTLSERIAVRSFLATQGFPGTFVASCSPYFRAALMASKEAPLINESALPVNVLSFSPALHHLMPHDKFPAPIPVGGVR